MRGAGGAGERDAPLERRPRWGRRLGAVAALLVVAGPWWAPPLLRRLAFFNVRYVEVRGARYDAPADVVARLGLDSAFSIWNGLAPLEARVRQDPQIVQARVTRRLPATLVVTLIESDPVAFAPSPNGLRAYDATGKLLPLDPSRTPVDLPVIPHRDTTLLRLLGEVKSGAPELFARLNEVRRITRDEIVLDLVSPFATTMPVRAMTDVSVDRLAEISLVENDLLKRRAHVSELDLRFRDQVIARLQ